ncbi:MAG: hypothetical protein ACK5MT_02665 [Actinomycetales bacterium]
MLDNIEEHLVFRHASSVSGWGLVACFALAAVASLVVVAAGGPREFIGLGVVSVIVVLASAPVQAVASRRWRRNPIPESLLPPQWGMAPRTNRAATVTLVAAVAVTFGFGLLALGPGPGPALAAVIVGLLVGVALAPAMLARSRRGRYLRQLLDRDPAALPALRRLHERYLRIPGQPLPFATDEWADVMARIRGSSSGTRPGLRGR